MSHTDDTNPNRGRPVLKRFDSGVDVETLDRLMQSGKLWFFCGEYEGSEQKAKDAAGDQFGSGIYKVFPSGSWPGGYLRD